MAQENRSSVVAITYDTLRFFGECAKSIINVVWAPLTTDTSLHSKVTPSQPTKSLAPKRNSLKSEEKRSEVAFPSDFSISEQEEVLRPEIYINDFSSQHPQVRLEALNQIKKLSKSVAIPILKKMLIEEQSPLKQVELLHTLSTLNDRSDLDRDFFKRYLSHSNVDLRLVALRAISKYKDDESFEILSSAIKDPQASIRKQILNLICSTYGERGIPLIMRLLHDIDDDVRKLAIHMCATFKAHQAISALMTLLSDQNSDIQKEANNALKKITGQNEETVEAWNRWWANYQATFGTSE
ncbi:MAG: HEAT repeat domain-containing protein [Candidatus Omnitrophica bacterium]|nr:HEAT repeat domain-containing protein [Candidatus Omnitrophota bacterium]